MEKLCKRYVVEFAQDVIRFLDENNPAEANKIKEINCIVNMCKYGYVSNFEAVKKITEKV